jgi:hypothetical protein
MSSFQVTMSAFFLSLLVKIRTLWLFLKQVIRVYRAVCSLYTAVAIFVFKVFADYV